MCATQNGIGRYQRAVLTILDQQLRVYELIRKQAVIFVTEFGFEFDHAGIGINLVIDRFEYPGRQNRFEIPVEGLHGHGLTGIETGQDRGKLIGWHRKQDVNRPDLGNGHDATGLSGLDDIAGIDLTQTETPIKRRHDLREGKLNFGIIQCPLVCLDQAFKLGNFRGLGIEILACDRVLLVQHFVTLEDQTGITQLRLILFQLPFCLHDTGFIRTRVDNGQHIAFLDDLTFLEKHLIQATIHLCADRHNPARSYGTETIDDHGEIALGHRHHRNGDRRPPLAQRTVIALKQPAYAEQPQQNHYDDSDNPDLLSASTRLESGPFVTQTVGRRPGNMAPVGRFESMNPVGLELRVSGAPGSKTAANLGAMSVQKIHPGILAFSGALLACQTTNLPIILDNVTFSSEHMENPAKNPPGNHGGARIGTGRKATFQETTKPVRIPISQISAVRAFLHARVYPETTVTPLPLSTDPSTQSLPVFAAGVRAGFPSPADDHAEPGLDLNELVENPAATFCAWAEGDSMIDLGILDGDLMIIDRSLTPRHDDVVVADVNGAFTVKRLAQKKTGNFLMPANPDYRPIPINPGDEVRIWGVVVRVIHDLRATGRRKRPLKRTADAKKTKKS